MFTSRTLSTTLCCTVLATAASAQTAGRGGVQHDTGPIVQIEEHRAVLVEEYVNPAYAVPRPRAVERRARVQVQAPVPVSTPVQALSTSTCFDNSASTTGYHDLQLFIGGPQEVVDWGSKACGSSGLVGSIRWGVRTTQLGTTHGGPGGTIGLRLYDNTTTGSSLGPLVAEYTINTYAGTSPGGSPYVYVWGNETLDTPLNLQDGQFAWSYFWKEDGTDPLLVNTGGTSCSAPFQFPDPVTGTYDCLADYDYPASPATFFGSFVAAPGESSLYLELREEDPYQARASSFSAFPNPDSYTCDAPVIGTVWSGQVDLTTSGHTNALVFGFDSATSIPLTGGQVLLIGDAGSGELLGFAPRPGPVATFTIPVPNLLSSVGRYVGTQAIHYGGVTPFALSNAMDLTIGTY